MSALCPQIKFAALDASGNPAVGWKLYSYAAGTSTPQSTYTSQVASVANSNPVILDARGEATVWLSGAYKLILKDALDNTIWTEDNVSDGSLNGTFTNATLAGSLTISSTAVTWSGNPTHSGNHTFSGNLSVNGNTAIGNASGDTLTVAPNAVTWSNNPMHSGNHTFSGNVAISGTLTSTGAARFDAGATGNSTALSLPQGATVGNTARADSTILDWYEEGAFTPGFTFGGASVGMSTNNSGAYTRIGNLVFFSLVVSLVTKGSSTGVASITGLPWASGNVGNALYTASMGTVSGLTGSPFASLASSATSFSLIQTTATGDSSALTDSTFANGSAIRVVGVYKV